MQRQNEELANLFDVSNSGDLKKQLIARINELIEHDLHRLISILYRLDISEHALTAQLSNASNAGELIANMIFDRQAEKQQARERYRQDPNDIPEDERW